MTTWRCCCLAAVLLGATFVAETLFGGCGRIVRQVHVTGLVSDGAGTPFGGAEVYAVSAGMPADDDELARIKADIEPESVTVLREMLWTTTDARGRYTLVVNIGHCRMTGPIAFALRALLGEAKPTPRRYSIVAQGAGTGRIRVDTTAGAWTGTSPGSTRRWVYEMPPIRLAAR